MTEHYVRNKVTFLFQIVENNYLNMSTKLSSYMTSNNLAMAKVFLFFMGFRKYNKLHTTTKWL